VDKSLLSPICHRSPDSRADLEVVRVRDLVVRTRTSLVVHVRGVVKSFGYRLPACAAKAFPRRMTGLIPPELEETLHPVLELIDRLTRQIREYDKRLVKMAQERYPVMDRLQQVVGVGPVTSAAFVLVIEDPHRFKRSRTVGAYLGLVPRQDQSGGRDPQLRITKAGDLLLRKLLTGAAHYILGPFGPDTDLRRFGQALSERGGKGAKKRAAVAVARKLAVLMHHLWITNEEYDPLHNSKRRDRRRTEDRSCAQSA
jgi:transposase